MAVNVWRRIGVQLFRDWRSKRVGCVWKVGEGTNSLWYPLIWSGDLTVNLEPHTTEHAAVAAVEAALVAYFRRNNRPDYAAWLAREERQARKSAPTITCAECGSMLVGMSGERMSAFKRRAQEEGYTVRIRPDGLKRMCCAPCDRVTSIACARPWPDHFRWDVGV